MYSTNLYFNGQNPTWIGIYRDKLIASSDIGRAHLLRNPIIYLPLCMNIIKMVDLICFEFK